MGISFKEKLLGSKSFFLIRPEMIRRSVDFPAPLGPTTARISELPAMKEIDLSIFLGLSFCMGGEVVNDGMKRMSGLLNLLVNWMMSKIVQWSRHRDSSVAQNLPWLKLMLVLHMKCKKRYL